ncbi:MAG: S-methyl-5-thioribose-1-phosphate isomerase [Candidatus Omnitrophota bacterium]
MPVPTIEWKNGCARIIDQRLLPGRTRFIACGNMRDMFDAIRTMKIRGAPAIGVAGAFGMYLGVRDCRAARFGAFYREVRKTERYLASSRPTARNLFWALERMRRVAWESRKCPVKIIKKKMLDAAVSVLEEDRRICRAIGRSGSGLIKSGDTVLTHCNAGALATADFGTALAVIYNARAGGKKVKVYADETRPVLQGARLTAWELMREGVDTTLICDNMAAGLMAKGVIDKVIVGADRIAANGDTANKIGTYGLAVLAKAHGIPFYVAAPLSTFDFSIASGKGIVIEQRAADEVRVIGGRRIAPRNVKVYNPAFDVTPHRLISAVITEYGVTRKPSRSGLKKLCMIAGRKHE